MPLTPHILRHQIRVDGQLVNAFYATKETALGRVDIARRCGREAEYAGTVTLATPFQSKP